MKKTFKPAKGSGDAGLTSLLTGKKVKKTDLRVGLNALLDELNSFLGFVRARHLKGQDADRVKSLQKGIMSASASVAGLKKNPALAAEFKALDKLVDLEGKKMPKLEGFVLPGDTLPGALFHLARARSRSCELAAWRLGVKDAAAYLNRLSDLLFLLAIKQKN